MNMNMNLNLDLSSIDLQKLLPVALKGLPYIFGVAMIGVFGYTAYAVNASLNIKPNPAAVAPAAQATPKITFDKSVITSLKALKGVDGNVPTGSLGTSDPFQ